MIIVDSVIGYGAPTKAGHHSAHGEPLGADELAGAKRFFGFPDDEQFHVPDGVREHFQRVSGQRRPAARCVERAVRRLPGGVPRPGRPARADATPSAARRLGRRPPRLPGRPERPGRPRHQRQGAERDRAAGAVADRRLRRPRPVQQVRPHLRGRRRLLRHEPGRPEPAFGVREHAAGAIANGLALSKIRAYQAGFLIFSDFQRGACGCRR